MVTFIATSETLQTAERAKLLFIGLSASQSTQT